MGRQIGTLIGVGIFGTLIVLSHSVVTGMSLSLCIAVVIYLLGVFGVMFVGR